MTLKACTKCGSVKTLAEFNKHKRRKDGYSDWCKICKRKADADYRAKNLNKNKKDYERRIAENPNYWAEYYAKNRYASLQRVSQWQRDNPEFVKIKNAQWRLENPDYGRDWEQANPEKVRAKRKRAYEKKKATPRGRLENSIKSGVHRGLMNGAKAGRSTFKLLGYTVEELKRHIELQFIEGMSWGNYGVHGWHIDHIIPVSAHNYETPDDMDFKRCWALSNLRPLWAEDNLRKQARLVKPFQPSLAIADYDNEPSPLNHHTH